MLGPIVAAFTLPDDRMAINAILITARLQHCLSLHYSKSGAEPARFENGHGPGSARHHSTGLAQLEERRPMELVYVVVELWSWSRW